MTHHTHHHHAAARPNIPVEQIYAAFLNQGIQVFPLAASGVTTPLATIDGASTRLAIEKEALALDDGFNLYVAQSDDNDDFNSILVFPFGANGNIVPTRSIQGPSTTRYVITGLAVDNRQNVYAAYSDTQGTTSSLAVYAPGASGNAVPLQTITGSATRMNQIFGIGFAGGLIYVGQINPPYILAFHEGANGNVTPVHALTGPPGLFFYPFAMTGDGAGNLYVCNYDDTTPGGNSSILVFAPGADGTAAPIRTIAGRQTKLAGPRAIALDGKGNMYVANGGSPDLILVFAPNANGNVAPLRTVQTPPGTRYFCQALTLVDFNPVTL